MALAAPLKVQSLSNVHSTYTATQRRLVRQRYMRVALSPKSEKLPLPKMMSSAKMFHGMEDLERASSVAIIQFLACIDQEGWYNVL